ncbi:hypothetical protein ABPG77_005542 [Micractinium sp. CCAP 211/92]
MGEKLTKEHCAFLLDNDRHLDGKVELHHMLVLKLLRPSDFERALLAGLEDEPGTEDEAKAVLALQQLQRLLMEQPHSRHQLSPELLAAAASERSGDAAPSPAAAASRPGAGTAETSAAAGSGPSSAATPAAAEAGPSISESPAAKRPRVDG